MFRISQFMQDLIRPGVPLSTRTPTGPVVIWNLIRRCNLRCQHCYTTSKDQNYPGELGTEDVLKVMEELRAYGVPVLILSGGEPLMRPDIFELTAYAKQLGFYVALSTNGTLINEENIDTIAACDYQYVGISIDGIGPTHDRFRGKKGAFNDSMAAVQLCQQAGIKVGLRFTPVQNNVDELPQLLELVRKENINKFYLSHLNYGGRGNRSRKQDTHHQMTRDMMDRLLEAAYEDARDGTGREYVTGNNDADGVYFLQWVKKHFPEKETVIREKLIAWGGNASGLHIANIDNLGNVHPDTFWWDYTLGNVKERPFSDIWSDIRDPLMAGLKQKPRQLGGRCGVCPAQSICGGNTRVRAYQTTNDPWWEDPGCYLHDDELGLVEADYIHTQPHPIPLQTNTVGQPIQWAK